jgi:uncharacterized membrane protein (UPF0127 family)
MRLVNRRTRSVLAFSVEVARTSAHRRRGLLGRDELARGSALVITRCNAVHTVGMRFPIDVAFVDRNLRVRKVVRDLGPWRIAGSLPSSLAIEFPAGALAPGLLTVGDEIFVELGSGDQPLVCARRTMVAPRWAAVSSQNSTTHG